MRIALATVGTTGDVRPFAALAARLAAGGHDVTAISWDLHRDAFASSGASFTAAGPQTTWREIRSVAARAAAERNPMSQVRVLRDFHLRDAASHYAQLRELLAGHDLVVLHAIHSLAEAAVRDLGARWASAVFDPVLLPTATAPPAGMPTLGPLNRAGWWLLDRMLRRLDAPVHDALRSAGSASAHEVTMFRAQSPLLHLVGCSPVLAPVPADLPPSVRFTGAWVPLGPAQPLPDDLAGFLAAGSAPVAITFGSMAVNDPAALYQAAMTASRDVGLRVVVQVPDEFAAAAGPGVHVVTGMLDHAALFERSACVVHHGGAGTTHAAATAGTPQVVIPHVGDQRYWAGRVEQLGLGPPAVPGQRLTADRLAEAVRDSQQEETLDRAKAIAARMAAEDGAGAAVDLLVRLAADDPSGQVDAARD